MSNNLFLKETEFKAEINFIRELEDRIVHNNNIIKGYERKDPDYSHIDKALDITFSSEYFAIRTALAALYQAQTKGVRVWEAKGVKL